MSSRSLSALFIAMLAAASAVILTMITLLTQFQGSVTPTTTWGALALSLTGAGIALCLVAIVHLSFISAKRATAAKNSQVMTLWTQIWSDVALGRRLPVSPPLDSDLPLQAAAQVLQDVTGEAASRVRGALLATGLVAADIARAERAPRSLSGRPTAALERLAWIAAPEALPLFEKAAGVRDERASRAAVLGAIRVLAAQERPEPFGEAVLRVVAAHFVIARDASGARAYLSSALAAAGPHLVWLCARLLTSDVPNGAHAAALDTLVVAHSPEAKEIAAEMLLFGSEEEVKAAALRTLSKIGQVPASAIDAVVAATSDAYDGVRVQAAHALVGIRPEVALPALWRLLADRAFEVRLAAAEALRNLGRQGREELRRAATEHPDAFARGIAVMIGAQPSKTASRSAPPAGLIAAPEA